MKTKLITIFITLCVSLSFASQIYADYFVNYGAKICGNSQYDCLRVQPGQTWWTLFPDPTQLDVVRRLNRMNTRLYPGMILAVPHDISTATVMEISPFDQNITAPGKKTIIVDPNINAWAAYDADGNLVKWGPASAGRDYCPDIHRGCHTVVGQFAVFDKGGPNCVSSKFPVGEGGAPMPYCMHFHGGFALHGSDEVPGFNASHGCVRMFVQDAQWLNKNFVDKGTAVIIKPYGSSSGYTENGDTTTVIDASSADPDSDTSNSSNGTVASNSDTSDDDGGTQYTVSLQTPEDQPPVLGW